MFEWLFQSRTSSSYVKKIKLINCVSSRISQVCTFLYKGYITKPKIIYKIRPRRSWLRCNSSSVLSVDVVPFRHITVDSNEILRCRTSGLHCCFVGSVRGRILSYLLMLLERCRTIMIDLYHYFVIVESKRSQHVHCMKSWGVLFIYKRSTNQCHLKKKE